MKLVENLFGLATNDETVAMYPRFTVSAGQDVHVGQLNRLALPPAGCLPLLGKTRPVYCCQEGTATAEDIDTALRMASTSMPLETG